MIWTEIPLEKLATGMRKVYHEESLRIEKITHGFGRCQASSVSYWDAFTKERYKLWYDLAEFALEKKYNPLDYVYAQMFYVHPESGIPYPTQLRTEKAEQKFFNYYTDSTKYIEFRFNYDLKNIDSIVWDCVNYLGYSEMDAIKYAFIKAECMPISCLYVCRHSRIHAMNNIDRALWLQSEQQVARAKKAISYISLYHKEWNTVFKNDISMLNNNVEQLRRTICGISAESAVVI